MKILISLFLFLCLFLFSCKTSWASISFTISNPTLGSDGEVEVDAAISGLISSSCSSGGCYLQAQFQSSEGYFGYTYNNSGEFVDYFRNPASVDEIKSKLFNFVPTSGSWSGKLKAKNNPGSSFYFGPGDYPLNFRRFSGNSISPTSVESNILVIKLTQEMPAPTPPPIEQAVAPTASPTPTTIALKTPQPAVTQATKSPTLTPVKSATPKALANVNKEPETATVEAVLGVEDIGKGFSPTPAVTPSPNLKGNFPWIAVGVIALGVIMVGFSVFLAYKKNKTPGLGD